MKVEWKKLFVIGLAFFTVSSAWLIYNSSSRFFSKG